MGIAAKSKALLPLVLTGLVVVGVAILYPAFQRSWDPAWSEDSGTYLKEIGIALGNYSRDHGGALPSTLGVLYPGYFRDKRIRSDSITFGNAKPVKMTLIYYRPKQLGDAKTPVAEIRLYPSVETEYHWRGHVLWGDLQVHLQR